MWNLLEGLENVTRWDSIACGILKIPPLVQSTDALNFTVTQFCLILLQERPTAGSH